MMTWFKTVLRIVALAALVSYAIGEAQLAIGGMDRLFQGADFSIVYIAAVMVGAKFILIGWLVSRWSEVFWLLRLLLIWFLFDLISIDAIALYSQLIAVYAAHQDEIVTATVTRWIRYLAELFRADEKPALHRLIAAIVLWCDLCAAIATAVLAAPWRRAA